MSRGQSGKVVNAGLGLSKTFAGDAASAFGATTKAIGDYTNRLNQFIAANPYKAGGEFSKDQSQIAASAADTNANAEKDNLARSAMRTGENTGGYGASAAEAQRQATRDQATQMAQADATRIGADTSYNEKALDASALPADLQSRLYGTASGDAVNALNPAASAAKTPSFLDTLGDSFGSALGKTLGGGNFKGGFGKG